MRLSEKLRERLLDPAKVHLKKLRERLLDSAKVHLSPRQKTKSEPTDSQELWSFDELREWQLYFAGVHPQLRSKSKSELTSLRQKLREVISAVNNWLRAIKHGEEVRPEDKVWLGRLRDVLDRFRSDLDVRLREIEEERALRKEWEALLVPEPVVGEVVSPTYPLLSPYESYDLVSLTDDTWLPVSRLGGG